jgi:hypothetical protein
MKTTPPISHPRFSVVRKCALALLLGIASWQQAAAFSLFGGDEKEAPEKPALYVAEPYIEMHTGPGRGYPVFNVVEQGEQIEILKRKPDWYKIRSVDKKTGWTKASELAHTLGPTGIPVDLPEINHGDYLRSHWRVGFTGGQLEGANTFSVTLGYRPVSWAGVELEGGKLFDQSVTSDYYGANLLVEPVPDWTLTPYFSAGIGRFSFDNRQKVVVEGAGESDYVSFGAGAGYYLGRSFLVRAEYRRYSVSTDNDTAGLDAWTIGLNAFF